MSNTPRTIMTKLIEDLELKVLMSPVDSVMVDVNGEDLLILIEYARQMESIIVSDGQDPKKAKQLYLK